MPLRYEPKPALRGFGGVDHGQSVAFGGWGQHQAAAESIRCERNVLRLPRR